MIKIVSKSVMIAAIASLALAGTTTGSLAAKKKKAAAPAACAAWSYKTANCNGNLCSMTRCGGDGKSYPSLLMCWKPACPK